MKWSYKLGEWFGIAVNVHATFLLLLGWVALGAYADSKSPAAVFYSVLFTLALFCLVVLHEYGHALMARHFGIRTRHITLYPIGGVAMLEGMPERPREQLLVALAGPAVNFTLAAAAVGVMVVLGQPLAHMTRLSWDPHALLAQLFMANILMGSFNLLPALPMDGGRVLRAVLAMRLGPVSATRIAARVAKLVALAMGAYGFWNDVPMLMLIAVVVWLGSTAENRMTERLGRVARGGSPSPSGYSTEVLPVPFGEADRVRQSDPPAAHGAPRASARVDGMLIELVQTPDGPRMRYTRLR
jgi:Zn-dependent protease